MGFPGVPFLAFLVGLVRSGVVTPPPADHSILWPKQAWAPAKLAREHLDRPRIMCMDTNTVGGGSQFLITLGSFLPLAPKGYRV